MTQNRLEYKLILTTTIRKFINGVKNGAVIEDLPDEILYRMHDQYSLSRLSYASCQNAAYMFNCKFRWKLKSPEPPYYVVLWSQFNKLIEHVSYWIDNSNDPIAVTQRDNNLKMKLALINANQNYLDIHDLQLHGIKLNFHMNEIKLNQLIEVYIGFDYSI